MLFICGIRRSMRTSSNITIALHMFFRTSGSSSLAKKKRFSKKKGELLFFCKYFLTKVLSLLEACFDFISGCSFHMKIQIMGGKITENLGFKSPLLKYKNFLSFFLSIVKFFIKNCILKDFQHVLFDF